MMRLDVDSVRREFPILERHYREENANVHRGVHALSERATEAYERRGASVARLLNAADPREIVFDRRGRATARRIGLPRRPTHASRARCARVACAGNSEPDRGDRGVRLIGAAPRKTGTARASLAVYNTREDIDTLVAALCQVQELFG